ncbi:NAD(P)-binding protein [Zopfia rhizophila CBS 207.26]|uniref:NAD(P)-binding protein n=1 Tax=Zopfia rhizophila CBS 207.26 TaxID=1314779 RepID=A0A6A6ENF5_9PEZI|nr:NAD(P)-binding protein [Zopfia rhizophila CBS 207.26]
MPVILITGASSGLGLAFLQHYIAQPNTSIIALDVVPLPPSPSSHQNIQFHHADITSAISLFSISQELQSTPIDTLIHSAGIRGLVPETVEHNTGDVSAAETIHVMNRETMMRALEVNTGMPKVIVMASRMGSISSNLGGSAYAYRASKAALNAVVKSFSVDVPEVVFLLLHPGRVETGLVGWKEEGAMTVKESLGDMLKVIESVDRDGGKGWSGKFVDRFGEEIGW